MDRIRKYKEMGITTMTPDELKAAPAMLEADLQTHLAGLVVDAQTILEGAEARTTDKIIVGSLRALQRSLNIVGTSLAQSCVAAWVELGSLTQPTGPGAVTTDPPTGALDLHAARDILASLPKLENAIDAATKDINEQLIVIRNLVEGQVSYMEQAEAIRGGLRGS